MYGMEKTTVYLPTELKRALERTAQLEGKSEAELIREGVAAIVEPHQVAEPVLPLFDSGTGDVAGRADELLEGFGES
jgi:predicted DNA-binding protein